VSHYNGDAFFVAPSLSPAHHMIQSLGLGRGDLYPRVHVQMRASHVNVSACIVHIHTRFLRDTNDGQDGRAFQPDGVQQSPATPNATTVLRKAQRRRSQDAETAALITIIGASPPCR
jgi:hypothetical protein